MPPGLLIFTSKAFAFGDLFIFSRSFKVSTGSFMMPSIDIVAIKSLLLELKKKEEMSITEINANAKRLIIKLLLDKYFSNISFFSSLSLVLLVFPSSRAHRLYLQYLHLMKTNHILLMLLFPLQFLSLY